ncbi:MAG: hypothetical protein JXR83_11510 [Deltaproteobacteria bacterium]|nr:hypothetical protein [Deltaproteobacteria bacterium]
MLSCRARGAALAVGLAALLGAQEADAEVPAALKAERRASRGKPAPRPRQVTVPIDVGVGPVALVPSWPMLLDQPVYGGMMLSLAAVIDQATIRRYKNQIPANLRQQAMQMDEVRIRPWFVALIPDLLVISPAIFNSGMYGAVWHPLGIGVPLVKKPVELAIGADLALCYLFMHSSTLPQPTHFLRPGIRLDATLSVPITEMLLVSSGWASDFFVPQPLGQPPWAFWPLDNAMWHLGGPFIKLHVRIPFTTAL